MQVPTKFICVSKGLFEGWKPSYLNFSFRILASQIVWIGTTVKKSTDGFVKPPNALSSKVAPSLTKANSSACLGSWSAFHPSTYQSPAPFLSLYPLFTEFWFTSRHSDLPSVFSSRFTSCPFQTCKSCTLSAGFTVCLSQFESVFCTRRIIWP